MFSGIQRGSMYVAKNAKCQKPKHEKNQEQYQQNGGPDPDDPEYYDYMVEHFPHLVNH